MTPPRAAGPIPLDAVVLAFAYYYATRGAPRLTLAPPARPHGRARPFPVHIARVVWGRDRRWIALGWDE